MIPRAAIPAVIAVATLVLLFVALNSEDPYVVRAEFDNAAGMRKDFRVTMGGVTVGTISDVSLSSRDTAIATIELDKSVGPVGRDARATVVPTNLLGEKVIQLVAGDTSDPAPSDTTIPRAQTSTPVELDDVFNTFDTPTRTALATFFVEQGETLIGRGGDLAKTLERMPPALQDARILIANLAHDNRALGRLVERSDRIIATVARERAGLVRFVDSAGKTLDTLGSRRAGLAGTIREAPGALRQLRVSLTKLQATAGPLIPAARGLRRAAPALTDVLRELPPFAAAARPALRTVAAASPSLRRLGRDATPVVRRLRPAAAELATFAREGDGAIEAVHAARDDLLGMIEGWARATQGRDALGHVFRVEVTATGDLSALLKDYLNPPAKRTTKRSPHLRPTPPAKPPEVAVPKLDAGPVKVPKLDVPEVKVPSPKEAADDVKGLLDYLLKP